MNSVARKLVEESGLFNAPYNPEVQHEELDRFVELLVQACVNRAMFFYHPMYNYQHRCGQEIARAIEEMFAPD